MRHIFLRSLFAILSVIVSISVSATDLNPFAYRIDNIVEKSGANLENDHIKITYRLSGPATKAWIRFWLTTSTWSREGGNTGTCIAEFPLTGEYLTKGEHIYTVDFTDVVGLNTNNIQWQKLRWTIDAKGGNQSAETTSVTENVPIVTKITYENPLSISGKSNDKLTTSTQSVTYTRINAQPVSSYWNLYYPGSVDICNDPYDYNFGTVLCTQARIGGGQFNKFGLFAFGGGMEQLKANYHGNQYDSYSGPGFDDTKLGTGKPLSPNRVRITDNGRVFVSALANSSDAKILYEVSRPSNIDNNNFYECPNDGGSWTHCFTGGKWVNNTTETEYQTTGGEFIAAPNMGMDVMMNGSALKILLMSAEIRAIKNSTQDQFHVSEYNFGTTAPATWNNQANTTNLLYNATTGKINQVTEVIHSSAQAMIVGFEHTSIEYDPQGGFWIAQFRADPAGPLAATLAHRTKNGTWEQEEHVLYRGKGGIRHNHDNTKIAIGGGIITDTIQHKCNTQGTELHEDYYNIGTAGKTYTLDQLGKAGRAYKCKIARRGQITIYDVTYDATGKATLSNPKYINTPYRLITDFAWDFADNLYITENSTGKLTAFALPHKDKTVSTPARDVFNFTVAPVYPFSAKVNPSGTGVNYASIKQTNRTTKMTNGAPYPHYLHNATIELTANGIPEGCKFYQWENAKNNTATITNNTIKLTALSGEADITAHIGLCVYEDKKPLSMEQETLFPASFVQRELDNTSYSTICLPFQLTSLLGTPYEGATVLRFAGAVPSSQENDRKVYLNFQEVTFTGDDYMHAGVPYLIKLNNNIAAGAAGEAIFLETLCPVLEDLNEYGGKSVTFNGITFHGIMNPTTFNASESNLFMTADNRLVTLYDRATINGLRAYFEVHSPMGAAEFVLNLPDRATTNVETITLPTRQKPTKYLWNGKIYIQQGNSTYDISGKQVK